MVHHLQMYVFTKFWKGGEPWGANSFLLWRDDAKHFVSVQLKSRYINSNNYVPRKTMQKKNGTSHMRFTSNFISLFKQVVEGSCLVSPRIALCMSGEMMQRQNDVLFWQEKAPAQNQFQTSCSCLAWLARTLSGKTDCYPGTARPFRGHNVEKQDV